ncbi:MAG: DUF2752 domain-containing protein [Cyanobacteria bacterium J06638_7]
MLRRLQHAGFLLPAALTGYLWLKGGHAALPGWPCPLRALTGIPCPTCFLTRATSLALRGDLAGSLQWHAFGPLAAAGLLGWSVLAVRQRRLLPQRLPCRPLAAAAVGLMGYWGARLALQLGLGWASFPEFSRGFGQP